ncbi:MAG: bifunctional oligoribonuclease/PAP phosphatase NrnA [Phycisphaerae bacterium]
MPGTAAASRTVPDELIDTIARMRNGVVVGHIRPDADCLGSMLGLARAWSDPQEPHLSACLPDDGSVSRRLQFLVEWAQVPVVGPQALSESDGLVVVDSADRRRCLVGPEAPQDWNTCCPLACIDHHASNDGFGTANWVVPDAASTAELVLEVLLAADRPIDDIAASLLFAGIHADTRGFTSASVSPATLEAAATLLAAGARHAEVAQRLYRSLQPNELELLRVIYANTRLTADGRIAYSVADHGEISRSGCGPADIDEQVSVPRSVGGAVLAFLLTEAEPGRVRISMRAETGHAVLPLARAMGGGGHQQAAGVVLDGDVQSVLERLLRLAEKSLDCPPLD